MNDRADGVWSFKTALRNVIKHVVIFAVFGPPIGALTWMIPATIYVIASSKVTSSGALAIMLSLVVGMISSYIFGLLPALLAGFIVGLGEILFRSFGFFHAIAAGLVVAFLLFWRSDLLTLLRSDKTQPGLLERIDSAGLNNATLYILFVGLVCVVPTLFCWLIGRRLSLESEQAS